MFPLHEEAIVELRERSSLPAGDSLQLTVRSRPPEPRDDNPPARCSVVFPESRPRDVISL